MHAFSLGINDQIHTIESEPWPERALAMNDYFDTNLVDCHDGIIGIRDWPEWIPIQSDLYTYPARLEKRAEQIYLQPPSMDAHLEHPIPDASAFETRPTGTLSRFNKVKLGLPGFANDYEILALADTGSPRNVMSAAYAEQLGLNTTGTPCTFKLGDSR